VGLRNATEPEVSKTNVMSGKRGQKTLDSFVISKSRRIDSVTVTASSSSISSAGSGEYGQIPNTL